MNPIFVSNAAGFDESPIFDSPYSHEDMTCLIWRCPSHASRHTKNPVLEKYHDLPCGPDAVTVKISNQKLLIYATERK